MSKNSKAHYSPALKEFQTLKGSHNLEYYYDGLDGLMEDHARNRFYDEILKDCKGKRCVDVGAGSGLLAFLALKHGAKEVICFEQNTASANHIEQCRKKMMISGDRLSVINDEFRISRWNRGEYDLGDNIDVLFHEIMGSYIWNELMLNTFDEEINQEHPCFILPSHYHLKFSVVAPNVQLYRQLIDYQHDLCKDKDLVQGKPGDYKEWQFELNTGVDIGQEFIDYYKMVRHNRRFDILSPFKLKTIPNCKLLDTLHAKSKTIHSSSIDINDRSSLFNITFDLPQINSGYLIMIRPSCSDLRNSIVFDFKDSTSFTGYGSPIVVPPPKEYNFRRFTFSLFNKIMQIDKHSIY